MRGIINPFDLAAPTLSAQLHDGPWAPRTSCIHPVRLAHQQAPMWRRVLVTRDGAVVFQDTVRVGLHERRFHVTRRFFAAFLKNVCRSAWRLTSAMAQRPNGGWRLLARPARFREGGREWQCDLPY